MKRRDFLKQLSIILAASGVGHYPLSLKAAEEEGHRLLFLIELKGGNDGLNTLVPMQQYQAYSALRPTLAHSKKELEATLLRGSNFALHPALKNIHKMYHDSKLLFVAGVGMEGSSLSHFGNIKNWERGSVKGSLPGWNTQLINRLASLKSFKQNPGYALGSVNLGPLQDSNTKVIRNFEDFKKLKLDRAKIIASKYNDSLAHIINTRAQAKNLELIGEPKLDLSNMKLPDDKFGEQLKTLLTVLSTGTTAPFFKLSLSGFDTHAQQKEKHHDLLSSIDGGLYVLVEALKKLGLYDRSLIMTYSEFGRNPKENGSKGTDHGTSASHFFTGGLVKGGKVLGRYPSLTNLVDNKHLEVTVDFRSLYSGVSRDFFGQPIKLKADANFPEFLSPEFYRSDLKLV